ncbi:MAG: hypothetical protein HY599_00470 [Candidatus Omnitrophica bacterium]|nr:hypothetical protein [Candidatus Omnitrophota bacterium]
MRADDLTVFVLSTGEETLPDCLRALEGQTHPVRVERITGVAPMSRAFQAMPERCVTPYFVQVDADMLLDPDAIERLHTGIRRAGRFTVMVSGQLEEEGFGPGGAVKCWKRGLFRIARFRDARAVDRDLFRRIRWLGLHPQPLPGLFGIHRPRHSAFSAYVKAKGDVEKWRCLRRPARQYALPLFDMLLIQYPESRDRFLGMLLGCLTVGDRLRRSKDLPFERALFAQLMQRLGWRDGAPPPALSAEQGEALRRLFAESYRDGPDRESAARRALTGMAWSLFAQRDGVLDGAQLPAGVR